MFYGVTEMGSGKNVNVKIFFLMRQVVEKSSSFVRICELCYKPIESVGGLDRPISLKPGFH